MNVNVSRVAASYAAKVVSITAPDGFTADAQAVRRALAWVLPSIGKDTTYRSRNALRIEWMNAREVRFRFIATDGHRLAWADVPASAPRAFGITLQGDAALTFARNVREARKGQISLDEGGMFSREAGACRLAVWGPDVVFPAYANAIPRDTALTAAVHLEVKGLRATIATLDHRVASVPRKRDENPGFVFSHLPSGWTLADESSRVFLEGTNRFERLAAIYSRGRLMTRRFSARYIRDLVSSAFSAKVEALAIAFEGGGEELGPLLARPLDQGLTSWGAVIMPVYP
jgi:hypothetical protein